MNRAYVARTALRVAAISLSILVGIAVLRALGRDGPAALAIWRTTSIQWSWVAFASLLGLGGHAVYVYAWKALLLDLQIHIPFRELARYFLVSNLGRYLPAGKAWQMGIIGAMSSQRGHPAAQLAGTSLLQGVVGVAVGLILLSVTAGSSFKIPAAWLALPVGGLALLILAPTFARLSPAVLAIVVRVIPSFGSLTVRAMWMLVWTSAASWVAWGLALGALAHGLSPTATASLTTYFAAWAGPFLVGLLAVVAPAGIGVREGAMQEILVVGGVAPATALVIVVLARIWSLVLDIVPAIAVLALHSRRLQGTKKQAG